MGAGSCGKGSSLADVQGPNRGLPPGGAGAAGSGFGAAGMDSPTPGINMNFGSDAQHHIIKPTKGVLWGSFRICRGSLLDKYSVVNTTLGRVPRVAYEFQQRACLVL